MQRLAAGRSAVDASGRRSRYVRYLDDFPAFPLTNVWTDTGTASSAIDKIYVVQTNTKVVERCMLMTTDPGDLVLDPTCGSGTTAYVAEQWGRRWITIDTSRVALALARQRLMGAQVPVLPARRLARGHAQGGRAHRPRRCRRHDSADDIRHGFVYERVPHVTLKSIANNPDINEGMTREEIDARSSATPTPSCSSTSPTRTTRRSASPGRSRSSPCARTARSRSATARESLAETEAAKDADAPNFEQTILDNLAKAGIQNGRRQERLDFAAFETYAGEYIQAIGRARRRGGRRRAVADRDRDRPAVRHRRPVVREEGGARGDRRRGRRPALRPRLRLRPAGHGVTEDDGVSIEASDEGFASVAGERKLGRIPVLLVRMNADLADGRGAEEDRRRQPLHGLRRARHRHATRPTTASSSSSAASTSTTRRPARSAATSTDQIALWMIDTDYDDESFFVRHCYFTGGNDPYKRLKTALKAEIDEDAWAVALPDRLAPVPEPETGKIAVKVINDYGDEVMKVFEV